jgi:hypothetical protein
LDNFSLLKLIEKGSYFDVIDREEAHFQSDRLPLEDAFVICLDAQAQEEHAGFDRG